MKRKERGREEDRGGTGVIYALRWSVHEAWHAWLMQVSQLTEVSDVAGYTTLSACRLGVAHADLNRHRRDGTSNHHHHHDKCHHNHHHDALNIPPPPPPLPPLPLCSQYAPPLHPPKKPNTPPNPKLTPLPYVAIPTFCKCTCFTNSTIIELGPASDNHPSLRHRSPSPAYQNDKRAASASCDQCNRDFCLQKYNLPICRDAEDKDVSTQCFQRDSVKDRVIVWGFIVGTAGLLGWAGVRGVLEGRVKQSGGTGGLGGGR